jgi:hypothetical protein
MGGHEDLRAELVGKCRSPDLPRAALPTEWLLAQAGAMALPHPVPDRWAFG